MSLNNFVEHVGRDRRKKDIMRAVPLRELLKYSVQLEDCSARSELVLYNINGVVVVANIW